MLSSAIGAINPSQKISLAATSGPSRAGNIPGSRYIVHLRFIMYTLLFIAAALYINFISVIIHSNCTTNSIREIIRTFATRRETSALDRSREGGTYQKNFAYTWISLSNHPTAIFGQRAPYPAGLRIVCADCPQPPSLLVLLRATDNQTAR